MMKVSGMLVFFNQGMYGCSTGDAAKVVARVRWAVKVIQESAGKQRARRARLDERRARLAQRHAWFILASRPAPLLSRSPLSFSLSGSLCFLSVFYLCVCGGSICVCAWVCVCACAYPCVALSFAWSVCRVRKACARSRLTIPCFRVSLNQNNLTPPIWYQDLLTIRPCCVGRCTPCLSFALSSIMYVHIFCMSPGRPRGRSKPPLHLQAAMT
jgi:hypothetical protein